MLPAVLIVDDCESTAVPLEIALSQLAGIQVLTLLDARQALVIASDSRYRVVAIITDLDLPHLDGFQLIESIRASPRYARLPIVVVSGNTDPGARERAFHIGADAFFPKPYSPADLRRTLENLLYAR